MSDAANIRNGIVTNLAPLLQENGGPLGQIVPYPMSNLQLPGAHVNAAEIQYDLAMRRGLDKLHFRVTVLFPFTQDVSQQEILDEMRDAKGATSVKTLLESDQTLGGVCQSLQVTSATEPHMYDRPQGGPVIGCEWLVEIYQ